MIYQPYLFYILPNLILRSSHWFIQCHVSEIFIVKCEINFDCDKLLIFSQSGGRLRPKLIIMVLVR